MIASLCIGAFLMAAINLALRSQISTKAIIHLDVVILICAVVIGLMRHG